LQNVHFKFNLYRYSEGGLLEYMRVNFPSRRRDRPAPPSIARAPDD
jgi:hypothetical protein